MVDTTAQILSPGKVIYIPPDKDARPTRHRKVLEKHVEQTLYIAVKNVMGEAYKFTSPNRRSVPDRMCVFPDGIIIFVECKAPGKAPTQAQYREMEKLASCMCRVCWIDSISAALVLVHGWLEQTAVSRETLEANWL